MERRSTVQHVLALTLLLIFTSTAFAAVCKGSKVPKANLAEYDVQAVLSASD